MKKLTPEEVKTIESELDRRERELQEEIRAADAAEPERPAAYKPEVGDMIDAGDANFRIGMEHAERQRDQEELQAIETARVRIAKGSYGACIECGKAIPLERLKAQPTATRCIACQAAYEQRHPSVPLYTP
jgi:RNA polymerase-binding protein DksA